MLRTYNTESKIYRWDAGSARFVHHQDIETTGGADSQYFQIDGTQYIAVANSFDTTRSSYVTTSEIFKWNGLSLEFLPHQSIETKGAGERHPFQINATHYLAVANSYDDTTHHLNSSIYRWDAGLLKFVVHQSFETLGGSDFQHFEINGEHYLAAAAFGDSFSFRTTSTIYKWSFRLSAFEPHWSIATKFANSMQHFEIDGTHFLAVANYYDDTTYIVKSVVYKFVTSFDF